MKALFQPVWLWNAAIGIVLPLLYINTIIALMNKLVSKGFPPDLSRKVIHIAAGSWIWVWPLMDPSDGWSYVFNIAVAFLWFLMFLQKGLKGSPDDPAVKTMTRTGDPRELLKGPLFFTISMMFVGVFLFMKFIGVAIMGYLGWGDGIAPYVGKKWGKHKYKLLGREKTVEGTIAVFVAGLLGSILLYILVFWRLPTAAEIYRLALLGVVATIVEAVSPADVDNLTIPAALYLVDLFLG